MNFVFVRYFVSELFVHFLVFLWFHFWQNFGVVQENVFIVQHMTDFRRVILVMSQPYKERKWMLLTHFCKCKIAFARFQLREMQFPNVMFGLFEELGVFIRRNIKKILSKIFMMHIRFLMKIRIIFLKKMVKNFRHLSRKMKKFLKNFYHKIWKKQKNEMKLLILG